MIMISYLTTGGNFAIVLFTLKRYAGRNVLHLVSYYTYQGRVGQVLWTI